MNEPIKVIFILSNMGRGGAEKQLISLLDNLDPGQVDARLLVMSRGEGEFWETHIRNSHKIKAEIMPARHGHLQRLRTLWRLIRSFKPDVVWSWSFFPALYAIFPLLIHRGPRLVASLRNSGSYHLRDHFWAGWLFAYADAVVANAGIALQELAEEGVRVKRGLVLPNSVVMPEDPVVPAARVKRVGYCGNFHHRKGLDVFVEAAARLVKEGHKLIFVLAGKGDSGSYKEQVAALGLADVFEFPGEVSCAGFVRSLDIFVLPSRHEGCPNVLLESMALGIPCVATAVGGVPEVIEDGKNGLMVPPEDPAALARAIDHIVKNDTLRLQFGKAGILSMQDGRQEQKVARQDLVEVLHQILV